MPAPDPARPDSEGFEWRWAWASAEGRCLAAGVVLAVLGLIALGIGSVWWPAVTVDVAAMTGLNLVIGRAAGMAWGLARSFPTGWVVACNVLVETVQVLLVYPLFVLSCRHWLAPRWLAEPLQALRERAERSRATVRRFGIVGLFVFVFMPFWMTGPVVGSMVGYLLGLRTATTLAVVLAGTYTAIAAYAVFLEEIDAWAQAYGRYAVVAVLVALAAAAALVQRWRSRAAPGPD